MKARIEIDGRVHEAVIAPGKAPGSWSVDVDGESFEATLVPGGVRVGERLVRIERGAEGLRLDGARAQHRLLELDAGAGAGATGGAAAKVRPPMNGKLERILVAPGQAVERGQVLFVLEAMKMQNEVRAPAAGKVAAIHLAAGAVVEPSQVILELEPL